MRAMIAGRVIPFNLGTGGEGSSDTDGADGDAKWLRHFGY